MICKIMHLDYGAEICFILSGGRRTSKRAFIVCRDIDVEEAFSVLAVF